MGLSAEKLEIPRKPKSETQRSKPDMILSNGTDKVDQPSGTKLKRPLEVDDTEPSEAKRPRLGGSEAKNDDVLVLDEDSGSGAILIDD